MNHVSFPIRIASPKLWYPVGYGAQDRYRFSASIRLNKKVEAAHAEVNTGFAHWNYAASPTNGERVSSS